MGFTSKIQSGAATSPQGFVMCFLNVPLALACLGSMAAQKPAELSEDILRNLQNKLTPLAVMAKIVDNLLLSHPSVVAAVDALAALEADLTVESDGRPLARVHPRLPRVDRRRLCRGRGGNKSLLQNISPFKCGNRRIIITQPLPLC